MRKRTNIYPCYQSDFKCIDTYKKFTQGTIYKITGFGNEKRDGKKVDVWWIKPILHDDDEFSVIKTTVNRLIDKQIIKLL